MAKKFLESENNSYGKMSLSAHLKELRNRLFKSFLAIILGAVVGWFLYEPIFKQLQLPISSVANDYNRVAELNFSTVTSVFDLKLQISFFIGTIVASPIWIYQIFAFVNPALTSKERKYVFSFMAVAVPLFFMGTYLAWLILPNAVNFLINFTPEGASNIINVQEYLTFVMRLILAFGVAFLLPVVLVGMNLGGQLTGKQIVKYWRIVVFLVFLFAAMATPSADVLSMFFLAVPMLLLFFGAIGFCCLHDKRKNKKILFAEKMVAQSLDIATSAADLEKF